MATFNVGVNLVEVDGLTAPAIPRAATGTAGFLVRSTRGVPNLPVAITSFRDFENNFGSYRADTFGAHAVRGFFDNGGSRAYAVRVAGSGAVAATKPLDNGTNPTLAVTAGSHGREDPGAWGNDLSVLVTDHPRGESAVPAQLKSATAEPYPLAATDTLAITANGGATVTIPFAAADFENIAAATAAEVAAVINRGTTVARATVTPNQELLLVSTAPGLTSALTVAGTAAGATKLNLVPANTDAGVPSGTTALALHSGAGFLPGSAVRIETRGHVVGAPPIAPSLTAGSGIAVTADGGTPVNVAFTAADFVSGVSSVTPPEVVAAINRQALGFTAGLTAAGALVIASNSYGPTSTIAVAAGPGGDARTPLGLATASPVAGTRTNGALLTTADDGKLVRLNTGLGAALPHIAARVQTVEFDLIVRLGGVEVERFTSLSMQNELDYWAEAVVNDTDSGSRYVVVDDLNLNTPGADAPVPLSSPVALGSGSEGTTPIPDIRFIGDPAARTGLYAFDPVRIQLLATPETTSAGVTTAAIAYCERRGDAMFVGTAPRGFDLEGIKDYAAAFRGRKRYGAMYAPWIEIANPLDATGDDPRITIPPVGHVLGIYARIGEARGVWKAPAGDEADVANALAVEFPMTDADLTDLVKEGAVNGIRAVPGSGIIVETSRTLSSDTRWLFVGTRRLFNLVKVSLSDGLRWVAQEPHDDSLRRRVKFNAVTPFLLGLWRQGAFGSDPADDVFTVICDETNNPPSEVNLGNFKVEVYFYPVKPAETIVIVVGQQESGASADDA